MILHDNRLFDLDQRVTEAFKNLAYTLTRQAKGKKPAEVVAEAWRKLQLAIHRRASKVAQLCLPGDREFVAAVDHRFALASHSLT